MLKMLFVCTGNTCRSPMAEAFFNLLAQQRGLPARAFSAGLSVSNHKASDSAIQAAAEYGAELSSHRPQSLTQCMVNDADLILTMTEDYKRNVEMNYPSAQGKTWTLLQFIGEQGDIDDPYGGSLEEYRKCARQLWEAVSKVIDRLQMEGDGHAR